MSKQSTLDCVIEVYRESPNSDSAFGYRVCLNGTEKSTRQVHKTFQNTLEGVKQYLLRNEKHWANISVPTLGADAILPEGEYKLRDKESQQFKEMLQSAIRCNKRCQ